MCTLQCACTDPCWVSSCSAMPVTWPVMPFKFPALPAPELVVMDFSVSVKQTDGTAKWSPDGLLIAAVVDRRIVVRDAQSLSVVRVRLPCAWSGARPHRPPAPPVIATRLDVDDACSFETRSLELRSCSRASTMRRTLRGARTPATCSACCSTGPWSRSFRCWTPHGRQRSTKASLVRRWDGLDRRPSHGSR